MQASRLARHKAAPQNPGDDCVMTGVSDDSYAARLIN